MHRKWLVQRTNPEFVSYLAAESSITPAFAQILINRGVKSPAEVLDFLDCSIASLTDPRKIEGVDAALARLLRARKEGTRVFVHGDYDVDGITATTIVVDAMRRIGMDVVYFVPSRFEHGYGFNPPAIDLALNAGAGIILTVDCGITSFEACELAASKGIDVIITDHHEPSLEVEGATQGLPRAVAIINPKVSCGPELGCLSGAGVAFKLAEALASEFPEEIETSKYLDLVTLGTLADSVPLVGENRRLAKTGLEALNSAIRPGIVALKEAAGLNGRPLRSGRIAFTLVPRLNAAGRLADAREAVELMLTESAERATAIAGELNRLNTERQKIEEGVYNEAVSKIELRDAEPGPALVLAGDNWHEGVLGIVASRIAEKYNRPTFILSIIDGVAKGSARSSAQFDVYGGLDRCKDVLLTFGGHRQAAGLSLHERDLGRFRQMISDVAAAAIDDYAPSLSIDAHLTLRDVSFKLADEIAQLEPYGFGNPEPVLGTKDLEVINPRIVGKNHLKMTLRSKSAYVDAIGFNMGQMLETVQSTFAVDAAYTLGINEWEDRKMLQLKLKAIRKSGGS